MARYLFCAYGASGHISPMLTTAEILKSRGHDVAFLTSSKFEKTLTALNIPCFVPKLWNATLDPLQKPLNSRNWIANLREIIQFSREVSFPQGLLQVQDLLQCYREWNFDILVSSDMLLGASLFAEISGCVWVTHGAFLSCPLPGPGIPPWGMGLSLPTNFLERWRNQFLAICQKTFLNFIFRGWDKIRVSQGCPPLGKGLLSSLFSPFLYIVPSNRDFDYARVDLPQHVHHVGPCLWNEVSSGHSWQSFGNKQPILYCTAGTFCNQLDFVRVVIEAVRGKNVNLFATIGNNNSVETLGALPPNVRVVSYMPQNSILPNVEAVVCNGGSGSTMAALVAGKPLIIVPMISDQPENAKRCERLGVAITLPLKKMTPPQVWQAIERLIFDPSFRERSAKIKSQLSQFQGPKKAADLLESLATVQERPGQSQKREADKEVLL